MMGGFYGSIHVLADSNQLIKSVLEMVAKKKRHKFYLSPPINGWVSIFPDSSGQDERVSSYIAKNLDYDVLHLMVYDDDIFCYWYYRKGSLVDEYNSRPDYFGEFVSRKKREKLKGNPDAFKDLVADNAKLLRIHEILQEPVDLCKNLFQGKKTTEKFKKIEKKLKEIEKFLSNPESFIPESPQILEDNTKPFAQEIQSKEMKSPEKKDMLINPPVGLFASDTMSKFADILGIPNAVTSYEYLASGETDGILEWDKFVEIL